MLIKGISHFPSFGAVGSGFASNDRPLTRGLGRPLCIFLGIIFFDNFVQILEYFRTLICPSASCFFFDTLAALLSLFILLFDLAHVLANGEFLGQSNTFLSLFFLDCCGFCLLAGLNLAFSLFVFFLDLLRGQFSLLTHVSLTTDLEHFCGGLAMSHANGQGRYLLEHHGGHVLGRNGSVGAGGAWREVEIGEGVQLQEERFAYVFNFALEGGIGPLHLILEEGIRVHGQKLLLHVILVEVTKSFLRLGKVHVEVFTSALSAATLLENWVVEKLIQNALFDQIFDQIGSLFGDGGRQARGRVEVQMHGEERVGRAVFACGFTGELPLLGVHHFVLDLLYFADEIVVDELIIFLLLLHQLLLHVLQQVHFAVLSRICEYLVLHVGALFFFLFVFSLFATVVLLLVFVFVRQF